MFAGIGVVDNPESVLRPGNGHIEALELRRLGSKSSDALKTNAVSDLMDKGCVFCVLQFMLVLVCQILPEFIERRVLKEVVQYDLNTHTHTHIQSVRAC